ncbi:MAG: hypothetical protein J6Y20_08710 [Lachnospiraceae bacterium]|nr:hypothetical protein [Lachnospiraceae bacterium]
MDKLCPFRFSRPAAGSLGGICVGTLCALYSEKNKRCSLAANASAPVAKTTRKRTEAKE